MANKASDKKPAATEPAAAKPEATPKLHASVAPAQASASDAKAASTWQKHQARYGMVAHLQARRPNNPGPGVRVSNVDEGVPDYAAAIVERYRTPEGGQALALLGADRPAGSVTIEGMDTDQLIRVGEAESYTLVANGVRKATARKHGAAQLIMVVVLATEPHRKVVRVQLGEFEVPAAHG